MTKLPVVGAGELIRAPEKAGFHVARQKGSHVRLKHPEGPFTGGQHEFMLRGDRRLILPGPHRQDVGVDLLIRLLRQAGVTREEGQSAG